MRETLPIGPAVFFFLHGLSNSVSNLSIKYRENVATHRAHETQLRELGGFLSRRVDPELRLEQLGDEVEEQWVEARDRLET